MKNRRIRDTHHAFCCLSGYGRRNAPEAPQRSEDKNKRSGAAVNIPLHCKAEKGCQTTLPPICAAKGRS
jgi:hypothetical protein